MTQAAESVEQLRASAASRVAGPEADWHGAARDVEAALKLDPEALQLYRDLADYRRCTGDYAGAVEALSGLLARQPQGAAFVSRSLMRAHLFDFAGALEDAGRAVKLDPNDSGALLASAEARRALGDFDGARADADRAVERAPGNPWARTVRAKIARDRGDVPGALADLDAALGLDPRSAKALAWRGLVLRDAGRLPEALTALDSAVALDANSAWLTFLRGDLRAELGDAAGAWGDLLTAARTDPHASCDFDLLGAASRAAYREPRNAWVHGWVGETLKWKGARVRALEHFDLAVELAPKVFWTRLWRGELHLLESRPGPAEADLGEAAALHAGCALAWLWRGELRLGLGRHAEAAADLDRALEADPGLVWARRFRAEARRALGDAAGAASDAAAGRAIDPAAFEDF